jgi:hypothetical protein
MSLTKLRQNLFTSIYGLHKDTVTVGQIGTDTEQSGPGLDPDIALAGLVLRD